MKAAKRKAINAIIMASERLADESDYEPKIMPRLQDALDYVNRSRDGSDWKEELNTYEES